MERWCRPGHQTAFRDIELVDFGVKVVTQLIMMMKSDIVA